MIDTFQTIDLNLQSIIQKTRNAAQNSARSGRDVTLVAVSKVQPEERIDAILKTGHRIFGENRVQEAQDRWMERKRLYADIELRLIGPLQTNKVKEALQLFDVIETLDRPKLAEKLKVGMEQLGINIPLFIQVNTGEETQKSGILPLELQEFYNYAVQDLGLNIVGLMCIPPVHDPAGLHFGLLKNWAGRLGVSQLSMGMSGDFETAIKFGATHVRVGSAIFGERVYS